VVAGASFNAKQLGTAAGTWNGCDMSDEIEAHIAAVEARYRPVITGRGSRLAGGERLWSQFGEAVSSLRRHGRAQVSGVVERVNKLVVARLLLDDPTLAMGDIVYEPEVVAGGKRFDFAGTGADGMRIYIEVKTVEPRADDSGENWRKVERRQEHVTPGTRYIVDQDWMGAALFNNSFASRSSFMAYTRETEAKLAEHAAVQQGGRGILVFCGTGFAWNISELEDFADFYARGRHRVDDPFAAMEQYAIAKGTPALARTLDGIAAMMRHHDDVEPGKWIFPVRGPNWG
jgi:hypothetical protein